MSYLYAKLSFGGNAARTNRNMAVTTKAKELKNLDFNLTEHPDKVLSKTIENRWMKA